MEETKPFTYDWWMKMCEIACEKHINTELKSRYFNIAYYCAKRASKIFLTPKH